jgi:aminoglycoside 3-N-acetyltransferase
MKQLITREEIEHDLRQNLGLGEGDQIAVHSSLKSLGRVDGGPLTLIQALIAVVGGPARGTVLMPCFTNPLDEVDILRTPCRLGLVPETFRTFPDVHLSNNHTHRVAVIGRDAEAIAACHDGTSPLGRGSPFHELARRGGSVVHIGCNLTSCSLLHVAEFLMPLPFHSAQIAYPDYAKTITMVRADGTRERRPPIDNPGDSAGFGVVQEVMERYGLIRHGRVGQADCLRVHGLDVLATAIDLLAADPTALLCANPRCPVCVPKRRLAVDAHRRQQTGGTVRPAK